MGSSSAYGYFPGTSISRDSAWAPKVSKHYKTLGILDTLYNIGTPGIDCYIGMPTGYVPPPGRYAPDPQFNITRAVSFNPDVILINFPSNNYTFLSTSEIMFCLQTMKDYANAFNIYVFISTTQPRDDYYNIIDRLKLKEIRDSTINRFGVYAMDFWTPLVQEPSLFIKPEYALGDLVHLNPEGHTQLKNVVVLKDIFFAPVATGFNYFHATPATHAIQLNWNLQNTAGDEMVMVEKQLPNGNFETIGTGHTQNNGEGNFTDYYPAEGDNFYRVKVYRNGALNLTSHIEQVNFTNVQTAKMMVYPNPVKDNVHLILPLMQDRSELVVVDASGKQLQQINVPPNTQRITIDCRNYPSGTYWIHLNGSIKQTVTVIRK